MGPYLALASAVFFGIANVYARRGLEKDQLDNLTGLLITVLVNNLTNLVVVPAYGLERALAGFHWQGATYFAAAGVLNTFAGRALLFASIERIGASRAGVLKVTAPTFTVLLGVLVLGEVISGWAWLGIVVVLAGVLLISLETVGQGSQLAVYSAQRSAPGGGGAGLAISGSGIMLGLLAGVSVGAGNVCRKLGIILFPSPLAGSFVGSAAALVCIGGLQLVRSRSGGRRGTVFSHLKGPYAFAGVFTSLGMYSLLFALRLTTVSVASAIAASEPLFTMLASTLLLGSLEMLNLITVTGAIVVLSGVGLLLAVS